ncbi:hypothetical protein BLNAU_12790 [Blattamonas nauphoetae]|uniref:Uncharacterized protein n=1 Tax=Blattamonas nauphoetae TaxID=2049346 RepID=A0ABQ9XJQ1_9EUKA|nr:hypothetical protein BLNAU_12790 [Blattamonas nauphoetae]
MTSFLCDLMGAESLETRMCVVQALCDILNGIPLRTSLPEWLVTDTTPFSVASDGTLKEETILGKYSILLTESMNAIDTLLTVACCVYVLMFGTSRREERGSKRDSEIKGSPATDWSLG